MITEILSKKILSHNNRLTVCPPGEITKQSTAKLILIPSVMRSGTHLLIDTIINNFSCFKTSPLYVDLDHLFNRPGDIDKLLNIGGYIIKTHFPQTNYSKENIDAMNKIIQKSFIISPLRDTTSVIKSSMAFGVIRSPAKCGETINLFNEFWGTEERLILSFEDLITPTKTKCIVSQISKYIDEEANIKVMYSIVKSHRYKIYFFKLLTRLLGKYSPYINTTISFAKTK